MSPDKFKVKCKHIFMYLFIALWLRCMFRLYELVFLNWLCSVNVPVPVLST